MILSLSSPKKTERMTFKVVLSLLFLQANNATLNAHTKPMVKAAKNAATVRMVGVVTTFQEHVLAHPDGEAHCKYLHFFQIIKPTFPRLSEYS